MKSLSLHAVGAAILLLAGCAAPPAYQPITPEAALPAHFPGQDRSGPAPGQAPDWWRGFADPALDALVSAALANSPDLAAAEANLRQSRATLSQIASVQSPQVDVQARIGNDQFSRNSENFANLPFANPKTRFTDYRGGLDASWEIDLFGHTARLVEAAGARAGGSEAEVAGMRIRVAAETARNVLDYRHLRLRIANAAASLADSEEFLRLVRLQRAAGVAGDSEVQQADIGVRNARALLPPLETAAQAARTALLPLTALTEAQLVAQLGTADPVPALPPVQDFAVSSTVLRRRPDVRAAERALAATSAELGAAEADRYPRFTLVGDAGWDSVKPGRFAQQASQFWNLGPQVYLPLLDGGRIQAHIGQAEAGRDAALAGYRKAVLAALADVESAMLRCQGDDGHLAEVTAAEQLQERQVALVGRRVDAGEVPRLDWLAGRIQQAALHDQQIVSRQALADDLVLLNKAIAAGAPD